jgi:hypothetical protein
MRSQLHEYLLTHPTGEKIRQAVSNIQGEQSLDRIITKRTPTDLLVLVAAVHLYNIKLVLHELSLYKQEWTATISTFVPEFATLPSPEASSRSIHVLATNAHYEAMSTSPLPRGITTLTTEYPPIISVSNYSKLASRVKTSAHAEVCESVCSSLSKKGLACCQPCHQEVVATKSKPKKHKLLTCLNRATGFLCPPNCSPTCLQQPHRGYLASHVEVRTTGQKNNGLYSLETIMPGELIGEYHGDVTTQAEFDASLKHDSNRDISYIAVLSVPGGHEKLHIDAIRRGSLMRFANHSCDPNSELAPLLLGPRPRLFLRAIKPISTGTEITFDYNWSYQQGRPPHKCFCDPSLAPHYIERGVPSRNIEQFLRNIPTPQPRYPQDKQAAQQPGPPPSPAPLSLPLPAQDSIPSMASTGKRKDSPVHINQPPSRRKATPAPKRPREENDQRDSDPPAKLPRLAPRGTKRQRDIDTEAQQIPLKRSKNDQSARGTKRPRDDTSVEPMLPPKRSKTGQGNTLLGYFSRSDPAPPR